MTEDSWQCPDPQCGGTLDRHKSKRVAVDPHTDKEVGPWMDWGWVQFYRDPLSGVGFVLQFLLWIGAGYLILAFFPGSAIHSPLATVFGALGFVVGVVVSVAFYEISAKRRKAALTRAVWYKSYWCQRCRKWWLIPEADHPESISADRSRNTEEKKSA